jgi:phosphohistidine phosphatase
VRDWPVDLVVVSSAVRARETAAPVIAALGCPAKVEPAIYEASAGRLIEVVSGLPDDAADVMLIGHNPGFEQLHEVLCRSGPRYPTGGLGTIELDVDRWAEVWAGCGREVSHVTPKGLVAVGDPKVDGG